jgi:hypothetical protein
VSNRLVSGGEEDPLYRYLRKELAQAATADIAVGFVMPSGLQRIEPHQIARLWVPPGAEHAHELLAGCPVRRLSYSKPIVALM